MQGARLNGGLVLASPDSLAVALCPASGGEVRKRKVGKELTWFYRHRTGSDGCPRRYRPGAEG